MLELCPTASDPTTRPRSDERPGVTLAALVAVLHVSILAGRFSGRSPMLRPVVMVWPTPAPGEAAGSEAERTPSRPVRSYCAGQLALSVGMAVLTLVAWLHVMRIHGATGL